jgi:hypothetical protein
MNQSQVESHFGVPDSLGGTSHKYPTPSIWKYGDLELHFLPGSDSLILIHMDDFDVPSGGTVDGFDSWNIRKALTVSEAEEVLSESGISYVIEEYPFEDNAVCLRADAGVKLIFSGAHRQLCPLSYSDGAI